MTGPPTREDREAIAALAHRIRLRDDADPADRADPELLAAEFVLALRARGWRQVPALTSRAGAGRPADPDTVHERAAEIRDAVKQRTSQTDAKELQ